MIYDWTKENIADILLVLEKDELPFSSYSIFDWEDNLSILGKGAYAQVYETSYRNGKREGGYALKLIGFGESRINSESFREAVKAQSALAKRVDHVVEIIGYSEIRVWYEQGERLQVLAYQARGSEGSKRQGFSELGKELFNKPSLRPYIDLQFILMKRLCPLISPRSGEMAVHPQLGTDITGEKEIMKLAMDMALALRSIHEMKWIHRDVKLENIFYDPEKKHYRLGDFGIATLARDGFVSTRTFTNGYGAPEVIGKTEDKYDRTADVYSLGMVLYLLLNELRFPASRNYRPNVVQYRTGFVPERPLHGSDAFCEIVLKMLRYDPDERYQSMDEVLNDLEKLQAGPGIKYQREHMDALLLWGIAFAAVGVVSVKMGFFAPFVLQANIWTLLFWGIAVIRGYREMSNKEPRGGWFIMAVPGVIGLFFEGFLWWKAIIIVLLLFAGRKRVAIPAVIMLGIFLFSWVQKSFDLLTDQPQLRWLALAALSIALVLLFQYRRMRRRDAKQPGRKLTQEKPFTICMAVYALLAGIGFGLRLPRIQESILSKWPGTEQIMDYLLSCQLFYAGLSGFCFFGFWLIRGKLMTFLETRKEESIKKL